MEKKEFTYQIGNKTYIQRPLVLGQVEQLTDVIQGVTLSLDMTPAEMVLAAKSRIKPALAVILTEAGKSPRDKDLGTLAEEIWFSIEPVQAGEVIRDFFDCNPIASVLSGLTGTLHGIKETIMAQLLPKETAPEKTGSQTSSSSSQVETSQNTTGSNGA